MPAEIAMASLLEYTDWERAKWLEWFRQHDATALKITVGPHGDNRFQSVGDLVRHIFFAEKRYIDRLSDRPITDTASIPTDRDPHINARDSPLGANRHYGAVERLDDRLSRFHLQSGDGRRVQAGGVNRGNF